LAKSTAEQLGISCEQVGSIIHEDLDKWKLRQVGPKLPECGSKTSTVPVVSATFGIFSFGAIQMISWRDIDKTWLYHYDPESKQQSMEWRHSGSPHPKKSTGKVLTTIFWDQDGILLIDNLQKGQTINAEYCSSLLVQLMDILKEKCCGKVAKGVLFQHWALATHKKLAYLDFKCFNPPTLFSGSGPVRLPPVPWTEKQLKGHHFSSNTKVIAAMETWLDRQPSELF
jgi:hypothetical protein